MNTSLTKLRKCKLYFSFLLTLYRSQLSYVNNLYYYLEQQDDDYFNE
jgi:hypothetical protein